MSDLKGNFVIKNSAGIVTLAGKATALTNDAPSISVADQSPVDYHKDASGVIRAITRDQIIEEMTLRLTPGIGANLASVAAAAGAVAGTGANAVRIGDAIVTSGFTFANMNWAADAFITAITNTAAEGALGEVTVTARRMLLNTSYATSISQSAWTAI